MPIAMPLAFLIGGYLLGSVPWAYLIGRAHGIDIRRAGSGNVGATNVSRVLGKRWGVLCFALDFLKGLLPVAAAQACLKAGWPEATAASRDALLMAAVCAPIAGHNWPVFLGFRGGKGVAVSAGALAALVPLPVLAAGLLWLAVFEASRYVSLASVCAALALPFAAWGASRVGLAAASPAILGLLAALALLVVVKHRANLRRLRDGSEPRFLRTSGTPTPPSPHASHPESTP